MPHLTGIDSIFLFYAVSAFVLGLIFGSFLNVVIHRVPRGESIVSPRSRCPACGAPINAYDNIPLVSFALLRGRCRLCRARIPLSYPMVELGAGLIFVAILFRTGPSWEAVIEFAFACVMITLVVIDALHRLLPNAITYPAFLFALLGATARAALGERTPSSLDVSFLLFPGLQSEFMPWRAALFGGALIAMAAPGFWLIDRLDLVLFREYFVDEDDAPAAPSGQSVTRYATIIGVIAAAAWVAAVLLTSPPRRPAIEDAYGGLLVAGAGALISGGLVWLIRAIYFLIRGFEGMGLGDIKMMAVVGAFLGLGGAMEVLLLGSIIGVMSGLIIIYVYRG